MSNFIDLTGRTFERLTVLQRAATNKHGKCTWVCRCKCGKVRTVVGGALRSGNTKSCGCWNIEVATKRLHFNNLTGRRFGRLLVLSRVHNSKDGHAAWNCLCDCGTTWLA